MRMLGLFSGIGGFEYAAREVWGEELEIVCMVEKDEFCQKVLRKNFQGVRTHDDVCNLTVDIYGNLLYIEKNGGVIMGAKRIEKYNEAANLYEKGLSIGDCANFYGITRQAMHMILKRRNVKFRSGLKYGSENHFYRDGKSNGQRRAGRMGHKSQEFGLS